MKRRIILFIAALLVTGIAGFFGWQTVFASPTNITYTSGHPTIPSPVPTPQQVEQTPQPQTPPSAQVVASTAPAPAPARTSTTTLKGNSLTIPSIGFQASVVEVGLTTGNAIDVPSGMQVGHWNGSAVPGTPGAAFLDGHLDGVFARLHNVSIGQTFSVNYGGQTFQYRVVFTETVALDGIDMNRALSVYGGASEGLNIMTCAGTYIPSAGTYNQRFIVYAVRI